MAAEMAAAELPGIYRVHPSPKADALLLPFVQQADLILCCGYDPIEMRAGWCAPWDPAEIHVVDIAAVANRHYVHQAGINFVAHCGKALEALGHVVEVAKPDAMGDEAMMGPILTVISASQARDIERFVERLIAGPPVSIRIDAPLSISVPRLPTTSRPEKMA